MIKPKLTEFISAFALIEENEIKLAAIIPKIYIRRSKFGPKDYANNVDEIVVGQLSLSP